MSYVLFIANNLLAVFIAAFVSDIAMNGREPWRRVLCSIAMFPVVVLFTILFLGLLGKLTVIWVTILLVILFAVVAMVKWRHRSTLPIAPVQTDFITQVGTSKKILWILLLFAAGILVSLTAGKYFMFGTKFCWDDLNYHAPAAAHWLINEQLTLTPLNWHAYFPLNAEVLSLWFMLPFHSDGLAGLAGLYWLALLFIVAIILGIIREHNNAVIIISGILIIASGVIRNSTRTFSAVDLAAPVMILTALAMIIPSDNNTRRTRIIDAAFCGLFLGFAIGSKVSCAPVYVILFLWLLFSRRNITDTRTRIYCAGFFSVGVLITGAFWYVRNFIITGNPLFPAEFGPFTGPFTSQYQYRTKLIFWILESPTDIQQWQYIIEKHVKWPMLLFCLAGTGYISGVFHLLKRKKKPSNRNQAAVNFLLITIGLTMILLYPFTPFSGGNNAPNAPIRIAPRFLILQFAIGILLLPQLLQNVLQHKFGLHQQNRDPFSLVIRNKLTFLIIFMVILISLAACYPGQQQMTNRNIFSAKNNSFPLGKAWQALETLPEKSTITWFIPPCGYQYYPLFGRNFTLLPCWVNQNGSLRQHRHILWHQNPQSCKWFAERKKNPDADKLLENLIASNINYVLVCKQKKDDNWPPQLAVMESEARCKRIYHDDCAVLWKISK